MIIDIVAQNRAPLKFVCPHCHGAPLEADGNDLLCQECLHKFPVVGGVPILINDENSVFAISDFVGTRRELYSTKIAKASGLRALYRRFAHGLSETRQAKPRFDVESVLDDLDHTHRVLVIGAANGRFDHPAELTYTDVAISPGIAAIADAHDLPFEDSRFDLVIATAVLQHVVDPYRVVNEIWRVLKPDGRVFASTMFVAPVCMGAYDFTRFSDIGHRRLFRHFSEITRGMGHGPAAALAWQMQTFLTSFSSSGTYRSVAKLLGLLLTFPLKYLDNVLMKKSQATDGAASFYFYGQKQKTPISDRELVQLYRGGFDRRKSPKNTPFPHRRGVAPVRVPELPAGH